MHTGSREAFLSYGLRVFRIWELAIVVKLVAAWLIHIKVLAIRILPLVTITRIKLRRGNGLSLILEGIQDVARISQERLVHGVRQIATPIVCAISLRVIELLTGTDSS